MIFIVVKFPIRPERSDDWPEIAAEFTAATRGEEGCLFFDWARSVDDPHTYVLTEGFRDAEAGGKHVQTQHFKDAMEWMPTVISAKPQIVHVEVPADGWSEMGELTPR